MIWKNTYQEIYENHVINQVCSYNNSDILSKIDVYSVQFGHVFFEIELTKTISYVTFIKC